MGIVMCASSFETWPGHLSWMGSWTRQKKGVSTRQRCATATQSWVLRLRGARRRGREQQYLHSAKLESKFCGGRSGGARRDLRLDAPAMARPAIAAAEPGQMRGHAEDWSCGLAHRSQSRRGRSRQGAAAFIPIFDSHDAGGCFHKDDARCADMIPASFPRSVSPRERPDARRQATGTPSGCSLLGWSLRVAVQGRYSTPTVATRPAAHHAQVAPERQSPEGMPQLPQEECVALIHCSLTHADAPLTTI